jgi:hypothetical protein
MAFDPDKYLQSKVAQRLPEEVPEDAVSLGDVAAMLGQGATFNFGDEILGALKAAKDVALTDKELSDISDLYRQYQKQAEGEYAALREENPLLAPTLEFAGGMLLPGGFFAKGAKGAISAAKSPTLMKALLAAGKEGAITGSKIGALAGLGSSEATVSDLEALGKDVLTGAAGGALIGGTFGTAGAGLMKGIPAAIATGEASDTPLIRNLAGAARKGFEGRGFITDKSLKEIEKRTQEAASELEQGLTSPIKAASKDITDVLTEAKQQGALVSPTPEIQEGLALFGRNIKGKGLTVPTIDQKTLKKIAGIEKQVVDGKLTRADADAKISALKIASAGVGKEFEKQLTAMGTDVAKTPHQYQGLMDKLTSLLKGELPPQDAYNLALDLERLDPELIPPGLLKSIKDAAKTTADVTLAPTMQQKLSSEMAKLTSRLNSKQITQEEYTEEAGKLLKQFTDTPASRAFEKEQQVKIKLPETILGKGVPEDYRIQQMRDQGFKAPTTIYNTIVDKVVEKLADPSTTGDKARIIISELEEQIAAFNKQFPESAVDLTSTLNKIKDVAQDRTIRKKILSEQGKSDEPAVGVLDKLLNVTGYGGAYMGGKLAGAGSRKLGQFNNLIASASDVTLMPIARALQGAKGVSYLGDALEGALNNKSVAAKNAAIFSIMQNPEARKVASGILPGVEYE